MKNIQYHPLFKMLFIFIIVLFLIIPKFMVTSLVRERERMREFSIDSVTQQWSKAQTVIGPMVSVPYYQYIKIENGIVKKTKEYIHFLPNTLHVMATIKPEIRHKGIYEVVVYNASVEISGVFDIQYSLFNDISLEDILVNQAFVSVGLSDLRGIENNTALMWNNNAISFEPGLKNNVLQNMLQNNIKDKAKHSQFYINIEKTDVLQSGISVNIGNVENKTQYQFSFILDLKGSEYLHFSPVGKITEVTMNSTWNTPKFSGNFLPDSREITKDGFSAYWNILHRNRNFPNSWHSTSTDKTYENAMYNSAFGTELFVPVNNYQKSTRAVKYAILIIVLTFLTFLFIELLNNNFSPIHPIQYILVGCALVLFYTLLLAISEHLGFNYAFLISAVATMSLITAHMYLLLKSWHVSALIAGILIVFYGYVFSIIQLEDYALLTGAVGLFVILAIVMHFARKIDWYTIGLKHGKTKQEKEI